MSDLTHLEPKQRIGRFEIQQALHCTGASATYKASDPDYERTVALKFTMEGASDKSVIEAHLTAARAASRLEHDNIACTHGGGQLQGALLLVSEYHEGLSLGTRFSHKESFAWAEVLEICHQACVALDYANSKGVTLNRLHPGNLQVGWDGSVKLLDFAMPGIEPGSPSLLSYAGLCYMAPEQLRGGSLTLASNIFSLSAMLYQMMLREAPFAGDTPEQTRDRLLQCQPKLPSLIKAAVPKALEAALLRGLAADPAQRFATGAAFYAELEKHRSWNPAVVAPLSSPVVPPRELSKPFVIGVKQVQPTAPGSTSSGSFRLKDAPSGPVSLPESAVARIPVQSGTSALRLLTRDEASPATGLKTASQALAEPAIAAQPAVTERQRETRELPVLSTGRIRNSATVPAASIGSKVDEFLNRVRELWTSPWRPLEWAVVGAGLILICALVLATAVEFIQMHHRSPESAAVANSTPPPAVVPQSAPAPAADVTPLAAPVAGSTKSAVPAAKIAARNKAAKDKRTALPLPAAVAAPTAAMGAISFLVTPADAQLEIDGAPYAYNGNEAKPIAAGSHLVSVSRQGYASESRTIQIASGARYDFSLRLSALLAVVAINSSPAGANIYVDGKDSGKLTPAELTVGEGSHVVTLRKYGFLDSINDAAAKQGQTVAITAALEQTSTDAVKTVGGVHKLFGGTPAGMVRVRFLSAPKGAQVQVNGQLLEKATPVDVLLKPGSYQVDFMADGYKTDHKVISVTDTKKMEVSSSLEKF